MEYSIYMPVNIQFGEGMVKRIDQFCSPKDRILFVCDPVIEQMGVRKKLSDNLKNSDISVFSDVEPNPSVHTVNKALRIAKENKIDLCIGLGGGSSLDTAKAVACISSADGSFEDYLYGKQVVKGRKKLILIPTTAGTGSECTCVGVYTDTEKNRKTGYRTPYFYCDTAIVDPELTYSVPSSVTAATGIDAFTHALEAYWNTSSNSLCRGAAMYACRDVLKNLYSCYEDPQNKAARSSLSNASMLGGWAFGQVRTTLVHALSFPFADYFHVPHGIACALSLVPVMRYAVSNEPDSLAELACFCSYSSTKDFITDVENMITRMDLLSSIPDIHISPAEMRDIAEKACALEYAHLIPGDIDVERLTVLLHDFLRRVFE